MFGFIKSLRCKHDYRFVRNLYGDEINLYGGARSVWQCANCGKLQFRSNLFNEDKVVVTDINGFREYRNIGEVSDGYHTFNDLYYYQMLYNAAFFKTLPAEYHPHKSFKHYNEKMEIEECFGGGWFIVMAQLPTGQISNHYDIKYWDLFCLPEQDCCDLWDGHTPKESFERLRKFIETYSINRVSLTNQN